MQMIDQVERLGDCLRSLSVFRSAVFRNYSIYTGVPVHCLRVKGSGIGQDFPNHVIDLLICRDNEAIQAVVFDGEYRDMESLFSTHLQGLPCEFLKSEELTDDLAEKLCGEIEFRLRCDRSAPEHTGCTLYAISLRFAIQAMNEEALTNKVKSGYRNLLEEKHLIHTDGKVSGYGHACGIFCRLLTHSRHSGYFTVPRAAEKLVNAFMWRDDSTADKSLQQRLSRLRQGLPGECADRDRVLLEQLLQTPLEKLFQHYPKDGQRLNALLNHAQFLSRESGISAFGDKEDIETYGDVIYAVRNLWNHTANRDSSNGEATETCEQLLAYLSFPLWSVPAGEEEVRQTQETCPAPGLRMQLEQLFQGVFDSTLAGMPLSHYFYAAACLTESEYPLWLYRACVQPWIGYYASGELNFAKAMQVVYRLSESDDENEKVDYFPLLYDILVETVSGIL